MFADAPDFVTQLVAAWPTFLVASPILAAMVASIYLQVQARLETAKKAAMDIAIAEKAHEAVLIAQQAGRAAASAARDAGLAVEAAERVGDAAAKAAIDAKNAAAVAHSAVTRSVRTMDAARETAERVAAERAVTDKETAGKLDETLKVVKVIHTLNNSAMRQALFAVAALLREKAERTRKTEDVVKADAAEADLAEHDAKQSRADGQ